MRKSVDMVCVAYDLLTVEKVIMSEVAKKLPVLTCTNYELQDKESFRDFLCLVEYDELAAFNREQMNRKFKKKHVVIIHNNKSVLRRAASLGYICIEISNCKMKEDYVDYQFDSLETMYRYGKRIDNMSNAWGTIIFLIASVLVFLCANDYIMNQYIIYVLFSAMVLTLLSMYLLQVRKIKQIILYILDAFL